MWLCSLSGSSVASKGTTCTRCWLRTFHLVMGEPRDPHPTTNLRTLSSLQLLRLLLPYRRVLSPYYSHRSICPDYLPPTRYDPTRLPPKKLCDDESTKPTTTAQAISRLVTPPPAPSRENKSLGWQYCHAEDPPNRGSLRLRIRENTSVSRHSIRALCRTLLPIVRLPRRIRTEAP